MSEAADSVCEPNVTTELVRKIACAGFFRRAAAFAVDLVILCAIWFSLYSFLSAGVDVWLEPSSQRETLGQLLCPVTVGALVMFGLYSVCSERSSAQATLGKLFLGIVVADTSGERISTARAACRFLVKYLFAFSWAINTLLWGIRGRVVEESAALFFLKYSMLFSLTVLVASVLLAGFAKKGRALHDQFAGTVVVRASKTRSA